MIPNAPWIGPPAADDNPFGFPKRLDLVQGFVFDLRATEEPERYFRILIGTLGERANKAALWEAMRRAYPTSPWLRRLIESNGEPL